MSIATPSLIPSRSQPSPDLERVDKELVVRVLLYDTVGVVVAVEVRHNRYVQVSHGPSGTGRSAQRHR